MSSESCNKVIPHWPTTHVDDRPDSREIQRLVHKSRWYVDEPLGSTLSQLGAEDIKMSGGLGRLTVVVVSSSRRKVPLGILRDGRVVLVLVTVVVATPTTTKIAVTNITTNITTAIAAIAAATAAALRRRSGCSDVQAWCMCVDFFLIFLSLSFSNVDEFHLVDVPAVVALLFCVYFLCLHDERDDFVAKHL